MIIINKSKDDYFSKLQKSAILTIRGEKKKVDVSLMLTLQVCDPASWRLEGENQHFIGRLREGRRVFAVVSLGANI